MRSFAAAAAVVAVVVAVGFAEPAHAQFRNQGIQAPSLGWLGLGSTWDRLINGGRLPSEGDGPNAAIDPGWNLTDEPTVGAGYFFAIGYQLWVDNEVALGAWTTVIDSPQSPVITLSVSSGLRYNFLEERVRPWVGASIQYLQLIAFPSSGAAAPIPGNNFLGNTPFFIGLRPDAGVEWVFGDEQSLNLEVGIIGFLVPDPRRGAPKGSGLFLPASMARVMYNIYF